MCPTDVVFSVMVDDFRSLTQYHGTSHKNVKSSTNVGDRLKRFMPIVYR